MKKTWMLMVIVCLGACASHEVRCDARLQPINPPSSKIAAPATPLRSVP